MSSRALSWPTGPTESTRDHTEHVGIEFVLRVVWPPVRMGDTWRRSWSDTVHLPVDVAVWPSEEAWHFLMTSREGMLGHVRRRLNVLSTVVVVAYLILAAIQWSVCLLGTSDDGLHCVGAILSVFLAPVAIGVAVGLRWWARRST